MKLTSEQERVLARVRAAVHDGKPLIAIIGAAGTGKTTIQRELIRALTADGLAVLPTATTNRAVMRMIEAGVEHAATLHSACYSPVYHPSLRAFEKWLQQPTSHWPDFSELDITVDRRQAETLRDPEADVETALRALGLDLMRDFCRGWAARELEDDVIIVEEASMLDGAMLAKLRRVADTIILVGDDQQLPPVKGVDGLAMDVVRQSQRHRLTRVMRQARGSAILELAAAAYNNELAYQNWCALAVDLADECDEIDMVSPEEMLDMLPADAPVLTYTNAGRIAWSDLRRRHANRDSSRLEPGEPAYVEHVSRKLELALVRGTIGTVGMSGIIDEMGDEHDGPVFAVEQDEHLAQARRWYGCVPALASVEPHIPAIRVLPAYALTVHRGQGSEWATVGVDLSSAGRTPSSWRQWAYTAVTRARERLLLVPRKRRFGALVR